MSLVREDAVGAKADVQQRVESVDPDPSGHLEPAHPQPPFRG